MLRLSCFVFYQHTNALKIISIYCFFVIFTAVMVVLLPPVLCKSAEPVNPKHRYQIVFSCPRSPLGNSGTFRRGFGVFTQKRCSVLLHVAKNGPNQDKWCPSLFAIFPAFFTRARRTLSYLHYGQDFSPTLKWNIRNRSWICRIENPLGGFWYAAWRSTPGAQILELGWHVFRPAFLNKTNIYPCFYKKAVKIKQFSPPLQIS